MKVLKGFCFLNLLFVINLVYADIYKWVDSSGGVHYSDTPEQGAQRIELPGIQSFSPADPANSKSDENQTVEGLNAEKYYKSLSIVQPTDQATIRNNQGSVLVNADIEPALKPENLLQIIFDGNPWGKPQPNLSFGFNNINRGTHTIAVQVLDKNGNMLLTSKPVQFFMQRPRVNMGH
jgi:hypothetical protein